MNEKGYRNKPLTEGQKANNTKNSKVRTSVGRIFGFMKQGVQGLALRLVGMARERKQ